MKAIRAMVSDDCDEVSGCTIHICLSAHHNKTLFTRTDNGSRPILPITVTIDTMLKLNGANFGDGMCEQGIKIAPTCE